MRVSKVIVCLLILQLLLLLLLLRLWLNQNSKCDEYRMSWLRWFSTHNKMLNLTFAWMVIISWILWIDNARERKEKMQKQRTNTPTKRTNEWILVRPLSIIWSHRARKKSGQNAFVKLIMVEKKNQTKFYSLNKINCLRVFVSLNWVDRKLGREREC